MAIWSLGIIYSSSFNNNKNKRTLSAFPQNDKSKHNEHCWEKCLKVKKIFVYWSEILYIHNNCSAVNSIFKTRVHYRNLSLKINHHAVKCITIKQAILFCLKQEQNNLICRCMPQYLSNGVFMCINI